MAATIVLPGVGGGMPSGAGRRRSARVSHMENLLMLKLQSRAAAIVLGGALAIGLPAGFALAAANHDAHGDAVSTTARSSSTAGEAHGDAVSTAARASNGVSQGDHDVSADMSVDGTTPPVADPTTAGGDAHGDAVSAVARDSSKVGGKNDNHGGAVSAVARGSHGPAANPAPKDAHGATVSVAARSTATSGEAHGDAVSAVAHSH